MSAPLIVPKGNDRSWTRGFYRAINKVMRRIWWENGGDEMVDKLFQDAVVKGVGYLRWTPRGAAERAEP